jgi:hypothetical protein
MIFPLYPSSITESALTYGLTLLQYCVFVGFTLISTEFTTLFYNTFLLIIWYQTTLVLVCQSLHLFTGTKT